jgi:putative glycosyltransferase (TIGR04372 family)
MFRHWHEILEGGWPILLRKLGSVALTILAMPVAVAAVLAVRLLRPWLLIRFYAINSGAFGHFAVEPEIYLCERDAKINVPDGPHYDLCYFSAPPSNRQLARMWRRHLRIWPRLLRHADRLNQRIPGHRSHQCRTSAWDRDIHGLLCNTPAHLVFSEEEQRRGRAELRAMGIPDHAEFICVHARDSAYMRARHAGSDASEEFRNSDIQSYVPAAEALADSGCFVIRMGSVAKERMATRHPRIIDYAFSSFRSDFMDIYLGAHCLFCLASSSGFACVPIAFRRPLVVVNFVPLGYFLTYLKDHLGIIKRHWLVSERRWLSIAEISKYGVAMGIQSSDFESQDVRLVDNSPEDIRALALEALHRLKRTWQQTARDDELQQRFQELFPLSIREEEYGYGPMHMKHRARYGAQFLRDHPDFLALPRPEQ